MTTNARPATSTSSWPRRRSTTRPMPRPADYGAASRSGLALVVSDRHLSTVIPCQPTRSAMTVAGIPRVTLEQLADRGLEQIHDRSTPRALTIRAAQLCAPPPQPTCDLLNRQPLREVQPPNLSPASILSTSSLPNHYQVVQVSRNITQSDGTNLRRVRIESAVPRVGFTQWRHAEPASADDQAGCAMEIIDDLGDGSGSIRCPVCFDGGAVEHVPLRWLK